MARIITSSLISNISGKLNGSVFQRSQGGLTLRNKTSHVNSNSSRSNLRKIGMATVQSAWQSLSNSDRQLWQVYATFIGKKQKHNSGLNVNGHQLFLNYNSIRYDLSSSNASLDPYLLTTPVLTPLPLPLVPNEVLNSAGNVLVSFDRVLDTDTDIAVCFISRPLLPSQFSSNQKLTLMKAPTTNDNFISIGDYYETVYGRKIQSGEYCQVKLAIYSLTTQSISSYSSDRFLVQ